MTAKEDPAEVLLNDIKNGFVTNATEMIAIATRMAAKPYFNVQFLDMRFPLLQGCPERILTYIFENSFNNVESSFKSLESYLLMNRPWKLLGAVRVLRF